MSSTHLQPPHENQAKSRGCDLLGGAEEQIKPTEAICCREGDLDEGGDFSPDC